MFFLLTFLFFEWNFICDLIQFCFIVMFFWVKNTNHLYSFTAFFFFFFFFWGGGGAKMRFAPSPPPPPLPAPMYVSAIRVSNSGVQVRRSCCESCRVAPETNASLVWVLGLTASFTWAWAECMASMTSAPWYVSWPTIVQKFEACSSKSGPPGEGGGGQGSTVRPTSSSSPKVPLFYIGKVPLSVLIC